MFDWIIKALSPAARASPVDSAGPPKDTAEVQKNCGNAFLLKGELDEAIACYRRAMVLDPDYAEAYNNLGLAFLQQGKVDEALDLFRQALTIRPDLARAHINCGNVFRRKGLEDEAAASFRTALSLDSTLAEAHNNLGALLQSQGERDRAMTCFQAALRLAPGLAEAHYNLGDLLHERGLPNDALTCFEDAIRLKPDFHAAYSRLGALALGDLGRPDKAMGYLQRTLSLKPDDVGARFNLAIAQLSCGYLTEGWAKYKYRFLVAKEGATRRAFSAPEWLGESLTGRSLLTWGDQGIGDEILFASMCPELIAQTQRCIIECTPKLVPLFNRSFPTALVVPRTDPPHPATQKDIDFQIATADASQWLRPSIESFPRHDGYLTPDPARVAYWKARLARLGPGLKVGFCWRSSLRSGYRDLHYTTLEQWGAIFTVPGVHFINLQYDECAAELASARQRFGVPLHALPEVDLFNDLDGAAALIRAMDLVITAPTAVSSLAAAQGVPTWEMGYGTTWVSLGTDHVPWLPSLRLYMRRWDQSWEEVITVVAEQLKAVTSDKPSS